MNTQLNIPTAPLLPNPFHLATNLQNQLDQELNQNLNQLTHKKVIFSRNGSELQPINGWNTNTPNLKVKHLQPSSEKITVAAIDSSSIHIAETSDGSIYASRVSVVFSQNAKLYSYVRIGPIIYYIDETNASKISLNITGSNRLTKLLLLDQSLAQRLIRERLERAVTLELARTLRNSIILIDGCLKQSKLEERREDLLKVLEAADRNCNVVVGLSKTTKIGLLRQFSQALYASSDLPAYLDVDEFVSPLLSRVEGHIVLARFSLDGHPYRVDVSSADIETFLSLILANDIFYHGYPETLRIAHHLSVLTSAQRDSVKSYLLKNAGVVEVPSEDLRRVTLGSLNLIS